MKEFDRDYRKTKGRCLEADQTVSDWFTQKSGDWISWIFPDRVHAFLWQNYRLEHWKNLLRSWKAGNNYDTVISQIQEYLDQGEYGKLFEYGEY